jgi:hypothetical protein
VGELQGNNKKISDLTSRRGGVDNGQAEFSHWMRTAASHGAGLVLRNSDIAADLGGVAWRRPVKWNADIAAVLGRVGPDFCRLSVSTPRRFSCAASRKIQSKNYHDTKVVRKCV